MISGLDHIVVLVHDIAAAVASHETLFGRAPSWRTKADGSATALFAFPNMALELMAPDGDGAISERIRAVLDQRGEGIASLAFEVDDIAAAHRRLGRVGLRPEDIADGESRDVGSGATLSWKRTRAATDATHGIRMFFLQRDQRLAASPKKKDSPVESLDHVVIATPDSERSAALYGARLGVPMVLDRTNPDWGTRLMFFHCGGTVLEVSHRLKDGRGEGPDNIWGLAWRVADADAARGRMAASGLDVSEVRQGRKPGSRVFTVRSGTFGVPTLMIEQGVRAA
jgi:catechol 2,3-dioxygenase-like lactoylglutathione lyase family enzyme